MNTITYKKHNDLVLATYDDKYYYIGMLDLPQDDWTLKQYNDWRYKHTVNLIPLDDDFVPQSLSNGGLKIQDTLHDLMYIFEIENKKVAKNASFKDLLMKLYNKSEKENYRVVFYNYVKSLYDE